MSSLRKCLQLEKVLTLLHWLKEMLVFLPVDESESSKFSTSRCPRLVKPFRKGFSEFGQFVSDLKIAVESMRYPLSFEVFLNSPLFFLTIRGLPNNRSP